MPGFEPAEAGSGTMQPGDRMKDAPLNLETEPSILPSPGADRKPAAEPAENRPSETKPAEEKPAKEKSDDANLFDEANLRRRSQERLALLGQAAVQQERLRREALRQQATRIMRSSAGGGAVKQATHVEPSRK